MQTRKTRKSIAELRVITATLLLYGLPVLAAESGCDAANELVEQSLSQPAERQNALLNKALKLCPDQAEALNNLGVLEEKSGNLDQAEALYQRAIMADPGFLAGYAGLADVLFSKWRFEEAAQAYDLFLGKLERIDPQGPSGWLLAHTPEYTRRANLAHVKATHAINLVTSEEIADSLTKPDRAIGTYYKERSCIDIPIHFDFDSSTIKVESQEQMNQAADAFKKRVLNNHRILIEGHTDDVGGDDYNQRLSERRAESVRNMLVNTYGFSPARFETKGFGKTKPVTQDQTETGRARNRRVTFVNLGPSRRMQ